MTEIRSIRSNIFREGQKGPELTGSCCTACSKIFFPPMTVCPSCGEEEMNLVGIGRTGKLFSYTTVHLPAPGFTPPYTVGYVTTPEGPLVFTPLGENPDRPLAVGAPMHLEFFELASNKSSDERVKAFRYAMD